MCKFHPLIQSEEQETTGEQLLGHHLLLGKGKEKEGKRSMVGGRHQTWNEFCGEATH